MSSNYFNRVPGTSVRPMLLGLVDRRAFVAAGALIVGRASFTATMEPRDGLKAAAHMLGAATITR
jgi:hypothetical protein